MLVILSALMACSPEAEPEEVDEDGDGFTTQYDCDDADAAVFPTADEVCDGIDNNCDLNIDEASAIDAVTVYVDADSDGYGSEASSTTACDPPPGFIEAGGDCDDGDSTSYPGAVEVCDGADNDCNGSVDDAPVDAASWRLDADGDGYGTGEAIEGCSPGEGYVSAEAADCADDDAAIYPGAPETCRDGKVNDCNSDEAAALAACAWGGSISESSAITLGSETGHAGWAAVSADLTGDGLDDFVVGAPGDSTAWLVPGPRTDEGFLDLMGSALQGSGGAAVGAALAAGDLDADGYADLVVGGPGAGSAWLLMGPLTGGVSLGASTVSPQGWLGEAAAVGDVDDDGRDEALLGDASSEEIVIVDETGAEVASLSGAGARLAMAGDVSGDGIVDVLVGSPEDSRGWLVLGPISGTISLSDAVTFTGSNRTRGGSALAGGDLDADGYADVVFGAPEHNLFGGVGGVFAGGTALSGGTIAGAPLTIEGDWGLVVGGDVDILPDVTGDGLPELVVGTGYSITEGSSLTVEDGPKEAYIFHSPGVRSGSLDQDAADLTIEGPQIAFGNQVTALSDVTGDGWADVFISSNEEDESCYLFAGPGY